MTVRSTDTIQRGAWCMLAAALILVGSTRAQAPGAGMTPTNATVQVSTISQTDPHPTTYGWEGDIPVIKEPGANYYAFYYTGTVTPDARVPDGTEILRIPVKLNDWSSNKRWLLAQLTLYYQQSRNLPPTALQDYQAGPLAPTAPGAVPGAPGAQPGAQPGAPAPGGPGGAPGFGPGAAPGGMGAPGAPQGADAQTNERPRGEGDEEMLNEDEEEMGGSIGGQGLTNNSIVTAFDPKVAAEWTFYYDQLVLWQYYCARTLLSKPDLLETLPPSQRTQPEMLVNQVSGMTPQSIRSSTLRESQQISIRRPGQPNQPMQGGDMDQFNSQYMNPEDSNFFSGGSGMGDFGGGGGQVDMQQVAVLREQFSAQRDYLNQSLGQSTKADDDREKYLEAAKQLDEQVYSQFMTMLKGIDDRQISNENFEKWVKEKRQEVSTYADTWRKLEHGETIMIDDTMFLVSKEKLESVPNETINVVKRERLTPADLLNADGTVRKPAEK